MCLGLFLIYKGILSYFKMKAIKMRGEFTRAFIIEVIKKEDYNPEYGKSISYWPVYEFLDMYGAVHRQKPSSTTSMEMYKIGDVVENAYYLESDHEILILTNVGMWKDIISYILSEVFSFCIGLAVLLG